MRTFIAALLFISACPAAVTYSGSFTVSATVPDNNAVGLLDSRVLETGIGSIESITITLDFSGGWNGDLYAYVAHESGFTVLLNRIGRTAINPAGSGSSGITVTFDDFAANGDIHTAGFMIGAPVSGTYQPDGRSDHPTRVTDYAGNRNLMLSEFIGLPGDGIWEIFVADLSGGDVATFESWGIEISGSAVPEPNFSLLAPMMLVVALGWCRRRS